MTSGDAGLGNTEARAVFSVTLCATRSPTLVQVVQEYSWSYIAFRKEYGREQQEVVSLLSKPTLWGR
jgi:hypothetical protein